jgi:hypothetical protein
VIQRGKKSAARLAIVTPLPGQRAAPPRNLSPAESATWKATVATKPAEWFQADSWPLLAAYCRAAVMSDVLSDRIGALMLDGPAAPGDPTNPADGARAAALFTGMLDKLLAMRDREGKAMNTFARAMRLTQQARYRADAAAVAHARANGQGASQGRPWDR